MAGWNVTPPPTATTVPALPLALRDGGDTSVCRPYKGDAKQKVALEGWKDLSEATYDGK